MPFYLRHFPQCGCVASREALNRTCAEGPPPAGADDCCSARTAHPPPSPPAAHPASSPFAPRPSRPATHAPPSLLPSAPKSQCKRDGDPANSFYFGSVAQIGEFPRPLAADGTPTYLARPATPERIKRTYGAAARELKARGALAARVSCARSPRKQSPVCPTACAPSAEDIVNDSPPLPRPRLSLPQQFIVMLKDPAARAVSWHAPNHCSSDFLPSPSPSQRQQKPTASSASPRTPHTPETRRFVHAADENWSHVRERYRVSPNRADLNFTRCGFF